MSASDLSQALPRLRSTVIDNRLENLRWRQNQIHALHTCLRTNSLPICEAITQDAGSPVSYAEKEFYLTMDAIRQVYETLDFEQSLKDQSRVKLGKDNLGRRVPFGLVAIRPVLHSRFYSAVGPVVAAIAAGNCVLLELENTLKVDKILAEILPQAMDRDCFYLTTSKITDSHFQHIDLFVEQTSNSHNTSTNTLSSPAKARAIAVVDRSADLKIAAEAIATACLAPYNTSPYSPDIVIVYELWAEQFIDAVFEHADRIVSASKEKPALQEWPQSEMDGLVKAETKRGTISSRSTAHLTIVQVHDRSSPLLSRKITGPYLILLTARSVMDATILQNPSSSTESTPPYLASYFFATTAIAAALGQFIPSAISYVNQIPLPVLYGPAAPSYPITSRPTAPPSATPSGPQSLSLHPRYTPDLFSLPRPQIVTSAGAAIPSSVLELQEKATSPLKPTGQRPGHAVGFFEQGIFIGLGFTAFVILPVVGYGVFILGKGAVRYVRR